MARNNNLPFERGDTYFGLGTGDAITAAQAAQAAHLLGKEYEVEDPDYTGYMTTLRVVQYDGTGDLTADALCVDYSNTNLTIFSDLAPGTAGDFTHPLDHKYEGKTIRDLDYCYVIAKGMCEVEGGATVSALEPLSADTDGQLIATVAGHNHIVGIAIDAASAGANATVLVGHSNTPGV